MIRKSKSGTYKIVRTETAEHPIRQEGAPETFVGAKISSRIA